jgi:hypothetical protein
MRSNGQVFRLAVVGVIGAAVVCAQDAPLPSGSVSVNVGNHSPVTVISTAQDQSRATMRGAAMVLDLHMALTLRNDSPTRIHGITLRVVSQEVAMGGKGSVTITSLNVGSGEVFPIHIDMQLVRPTQVAGGGPLAQVDLDGVLFQDLSFFGPDRLNSRRYLTACEKEAQRDRDHFKRILAASGKEGLRREMIDSLQRQSDLQPLAVKVRRGGPVVTSAAAAPTERMAEFAFLQIPDSPVEPVKGWAQIAANEARAPQVEVRNRSGKPIKHVELGWIVSDQAGKQYMAAALPSAESGLYLPPGQSARVLQESTLNFSSNGQPVNVRKMTGFVNQVEFADNTVWVPSRQTIDQPVLHKVLSPSAEEVRLSNLYYRKGLDALVDELKKY